VFAYCRNNPVSRIDASGYGDVDFKETNADEADVAPEEHELGYGDGSYSSNMGAGNFRQGLKNLTGESGTGQDAHHIFPQHFEEPFADLGIEIHDPHFGSWWDASAHRQASYEYNQWWYAFFSIDGVTATDAFALVEFLAKLFGFDLNF
jgi:hypothetical protein